MDANATIRLEELRSLILPVLEPVGVEEIALFGSTARGEEMMESDLDVLVRFQDPPCKPLGLLTWGRLERELAARCGKKVDLVSARGLNRHLRPIVEAEKVVLYAQAR
jgi:predicted nucleotidyltransferase